MHVKFPCTKVGGWGGRGYDANHAISVQEKICEKNLNHFSVCTCDPFVGTVIIFFASFQFYGMSMKRKFYFSAPDSGVIKP